MDSNGTFPVDSIVTVHSLGEQWSRFGKHVSPYVRKQRHRAGDQGEEHSTEGSDQEQREEETSPDGTAAKDQPEGFEIII